MNTTPTHKILRVMIRFITMTLLVIGASNCTLSHQSDSFESTESLCGEAVGHVATCTGVSVELAAGECNENEAQRLLDTSCEVLNQTLTASGNTKTDSPTGQALPLTCKWFNIGCPADTSCLPELTEAEHAQLTLLSDPTTLTNEFDAQYRVNTIAAIFRDAGDPRGLFATVYRLITNRAIESVENGDYEDAAWARSLITEFARRYLRNLHGHLTGGDITGQWAKYYDLAQNCRVGRARTAGVAIAVHLMVDLPYTLHSIDSGPERREDFVLFGDILLEVFDDLVTDLQADYNTDVQDLFNGFFLGDWVDSYTKQGTMTAFMYQGIRLKAWQDSQNLRYMPRWLVTADIKARWGLAEHALAKLDATGVL